jgi:hypothetical protein
MTMKQCGTHRDGTPDADVRAAGATAILSKPSDDLAWLELVKQALAAG